MQGRSDYFVALLAVAVSFIISVSNREKWPGTA